MGGFSADFSDFARFVEDTDKITAFVSRSARPLVDLAGQEYANDVKVIAPYLTGTLRRSIHSESTEEAGHPIALVGTNVPYARRLEFGFVDTDSLGRTYHQPPRPYWRPAWDNNHAKYERILNGVFDRAGWESDVATFEGVRPDLSARI